MYVGKNYLGQNHTEIGIKLGGEKSPRHYLPDYASSNVKDYVT